MNGSFDIDPASTFPGFALVIVIIRNETKRYATAPAVKSGRLYVHTQRTDSCGKIRSAIIKFLRVQKNYDGLMDVSTASTSSDPPISQERTHFNHSLCVNAYPCSIIIT